MKRLSLIIPFYNEAESAPLLFERLNSVERDLLERGIALELILVDDGSRDSTWEILKQRREERPQTILVKLTRNFGAWPACRAGMGFVTGDCFMFLSADLQDPPELIVTLAEKWLEGNRFTICERNTRRDPPSAKFFSELYYRLVRLLAVPDFPKHGYEIALMDRSMLAYLKECAKSVNLSLLAYWLGFQPVVLSYDRPGRIRGVSGWSIPKKITFFLDSLLGFTVLPLRLLSLAGVAVAAVSAAYGIWVLIYGLLGWIEAPGFATIVSLICFLLGLIILMLGVIGEYLWRVFDEINNRPEWVIEEVCDHRKESEK